MTLCLWLYAKARGVGSAREVVRLCERDDAYRWIVGGLSLNHHSLSDFRNDHGDAVDGLMTELLAVLTHRELLTLERVWQDGMRVRASTWWTAASRRWERLMRLRRSG